MLYREYAYNFGNIVKRDKVEILDLDVECPCCKDIVDGLLEGGSDTITPMCDCMDDEWVKEIDLDDARMERDEAMVGVQELEEEAAELRDRIYELERELLAAQ